MPTFEEYVEVNAEMDISPKEFVDACNWNEIEELVEALRGNRHLTKGIPLPVLDNIFDEEWSEVLQKLAHSRLVMSLEDIEAIKSITKKY